MRMDNKKWIALSAACFIFMIASSLMIKEGLSILGEAAELRWMDALSAGDLLNAFGVFGGLVIAAWNYKKEQLRKEEKHEEELKQAKPQIDCFLEEDYAGVFVGLSNVGSRSLTCLVYDCEPISESLMPGATVRFLLTFDDPKLFVPDYCDCKIIESRDEFVGGCPALIVFEAYDAISRKWCFEIHVEDFGVKKIESNLV